MKPLIASMFIVLLLVCARAQDAPPPHLVAQVGDLSLVATDGGATAIVPGDTYDADAPPLPDATLHWTSGGIDVTVNLSGQKPTETPKEARERIVTEVGFWKDLFPPDQPAGG